ncbi:DAZ-associated protein 2 [Scaptodrosophila lebanonensis]|uniref:DAZ-associated protein 2 n=1 Tax=Drosophila lebanonensis TaxID=7225 RepID=A0A6J2U750_DROLE|nr:DAZ-associated protein 2 [Scaptodrosophila lebanonensis]
MSKSNIEKPEEAKAPTAPSAPYSNLYDSAAAIAMRAPPPTYEESQRVSYPTLSTPQASVTHSNFTPAQVFQPPMGPGQVYQLTTTPAQFYQPPMGDNRYYGMTHHQQLPAQVQRQPHNAIPTGASASHVLTLDARAEMRTTANGAVVIPPPPPGCLPTPAQLAAMQGEPVVLKQKKRSFF